MAPSSRDRICVGLQRLKATLMARTRQRRVSLSALVREAVTRDLGREVVATPCHVVATGGFVSSTASVKLSIRMTPEEAEQLAVG